MYFQHLYAKRVKLNELVAMQRYLTAQTNVRTADSKQLMNHAIENLAPIRLNARVKERIEELHLEKAPRFNAVGIEDILIGTSATFMRSVSVDLREQYFSDALHFFQEKYGAENVLYCMRHVNEANPHIHVGIVPITSDGHFSASNLFGSKSLKVLRTEFHKAVASKYGLERGKSHESKYVEQVKSNLERLKSKLKMLAEGLEDSENNQAV